MKCKKQIIIGFAIILFALLLGTESMAATAIVNTDTLRLRKEASTDSTVITLLDKGEKLDVIEESGDWVKIKVKGITGFVHKDFVDIKEDEKQEENKEEEIVSQENTIKEENVVKEEVITEPENVIEENTNVDESQITEVEDTKDFTITETSLIADSDVYILPLINSNKIGNLKKDVKVTLMDEVKGWFYIQADEFNGWVRSDKVEEIKEEITTPADTNIQNPPQNQDEEDNKQEDNKQNEEENKIDEVAIDRKVMYVNYTSVYVRKGPGTENPVVDSLILNNQVTVIAESGDWYKVEVGNITGYIAKRLLSNTKTETTDRNAEEREDVVANVNQNQGQVTTNSQVTTSSKGQEIVDFAKKYLGCRYVYGGSGPSTFDCSGFTMYVYKNFGINLSHSARAQSKNGVYVAKSDLQPGDLVFFKDYETMDGIGHCGIYIGDGNFIHASSGTGYCVKISTLLSGSYNTRYETARRLI